MLHMIHTTLIINMTSSADGNPNMCTFIGYPSTRLTSIWVDHPIRHSGEKRNAAQNEKKGLVSNDKWNVAKSLRRNGGVT